jgi:glycosyltransferase involved in cell wall biosynthesis
LPFEGSSLSERLKLALFSDILKEGVDGVTHTLHSLIQRVPASSVDLLLVTGYPPSPGVQLPFPVLVVPRLINPFHDDAPLSWPFFNRRLGQRLDAFAPDLVHFSSPSFLGWYALSYGKRRGIPVVSIYHTHFLSYFPYYFRRWPRLRMQSKRLFEWFMRKLYNRCDRLFVPTPSIRSELVQVGIEAGRLAVWGRGVDTELFHPGRRDLAYADDLCGPGTRRVLFVGRLVWEKELHTLAGIYERFQATRPDIRMVVTGTGRRERELRRLMPRAVFTGRLKGTELARMYASADVFVQPSMTDTFSNVVLEAMASGLPCVVAACGGPRDVVHDAVDGYHAVPRDVEDFCARIEELVDNPERRRTFGERAAAFARTQQWDDLCRDLLDQYARVARGVSC